jgi:hypothetical protein
MPYTSRRKALKLNAWGSTPSATPLWGLSKRELVEIALHQAALLNHHGYDQALENGEAARSVMIEHRALRKAGLL